jgi:hypothetical protein
MTQSDNIDLDKLEDELIIHAHSGERETHVIQSAKAYLSLMRTTDKERQDALRIIDHMIQNEAVIYSLENLETIRRALAMPAWQPIDTAPKDGTEFLAFAWYNISGVAYHFMEVCYLRNGIFEGWGHDGIDGDGVWPTHWMPLPSAPEEPPHDQ